MSIEFKNITASIKGKRIVSNVSLSVPDHRMVGVIGPNGSGKSTLIKTFFSLAEYQQGEIFLAGKNLKAYAKKEVAKQVAYIGQESIPAFDFTVREVVKMGRFPYGQKEPDVNQVIDAALETLKIGGLSERNVRSLSGGERKLVYLARAIAQNTDTIILDEPTNHLDIKHQLMIMKYLRNSNKTILIVIHDLNLAAKFCDDIYMLAEGEVFLKGPTKDVFTSNNIKKIFEVDGSVAQDTTGKLFFLVK